MRANLGQHFLTDTSVVDKIIDAAALSINDTVLEIGPGKGVLTEKLIEAAGKIVAVEKDEELCRYLKKKFDASNLELIQDDIRNFSLGNLPEVYKVVANIPYYLTGQLIPLLLTAPRPPKLLVLMIQKEVAERLTAPKGHSSLLQLTTQVFAQTAIVGIVNRAAFTPAPEVDSAVIVIKPHSIPKVPADVQKNFFRILKFAFSGKRKKLVNTLSAGMRISRDDVKGALNEVGLTEFARPQELDLDQWIALFRVLAKVPQGVL